MSSTMNVLPDVNFWLALLLRKHAGHATARAWWEQHPDAVGFFCRVTEMGVLRGLTNRAIAQEDVQTQEQAWRTYDACRANPRVGFAYELQGLEAVWRSHSSRSTPAVKRWTDDYLAALALIHGLRMVTFDAGFKDYPGLMVELLVMPAPVSVPIS